MHVSTAREDLRNLSDEALAPRACAGSMEAFEEIVRRFQTPLLKFLMRRFPSRRDAEDILQETFLKAHQSLHMYRDAWRFRTWMFTIAYRLAVSHGRRRTLPQRPMPAGDLADADEVPGQAAMAGELRERLWRTARIVLNEEQYMILWLHYGHDMPAAEIGRIMNKSWVSIKTIMHRARKKLEPHLAEDRPGRRAATYSVSTGEL